MKIQLVTSYTLKHDVNRCFWNPAWSKCKHVYNFVYAFCGTDITVGAQYATLTISSCRGASIE
jgi:hypothetical protein